MTVRELPPELAKIAEKELNENPKRLQEDLRDIKDWISKQAHLKARTDDQWLVAALRGCKFSLERVKKKLDLYYTLRTTASDVTKRLKPTEPRFLEVLRLGSCVILPKAKDISPRVVLLRPGAFDANVYNIVDVLCVFYYLAQILVVEDDISTVVGTKVLVDYEGLNMGHLAQVNPSLVKKMIVIIQDSMPIRLKGNHHINMPSFIEAIFSLVKSLISEKAKHRLKVHKSNTELLNDLPKDIIPAEYGGDGGSIKDILGVWETKCLEYRAWFQEEEHLGTDESKRPGRPQSAEDMFGLDGSFRKLELD